MGVQWALFRYQQSPQRNTIISIVDELGYVINGVIHGKSAISLILWACGGSLFLVLLSIVIVAWLKKKSFNETFLSFVL